MDLPRESSGPLSYKEMKDLNPFFTHESFLRVDQIDAFEGLLERNAGETEIDNFLTENPEIFTAAVHNHRRGHHGTIVIPKQQIRPRVQSSGLRGLIPDFIIGGDSSDGWQYWIVELKGASQSLFVERNDEVYLTSEINKGVCQLIEYVDFCCENQQFLRDHFKMVGFREPKGLLIAGREEELTLNQKKKDFKGAWNRHSHSLEIRTYDWIRRNLRPMLRFQSELR